MEGKGSFIILLVIVAILTITLAVMAGYLFLIAGNQQTGYQKVSTDVETVRPPESVLASRKLFEEKQFFNLKNDGDKFSVIQLNLEMIYFKNLKGIKNVEDKLNFNTAKIKQIVGIYFQNLTLEDVKKPEARERAAEELKKKLNEFLVSNEKQKDDIIYEIIFDEWFYQ